VKDRAKQSLSSWYQSPVLITVQFGSKEVLLWLFDFGLLQQLWPRFVHSRSAAFFSIPFPLARSGQEFPDPIDLVKKKREGSSCYV
jgi:hypothetical protein